jgi:hypothetical protein
MRERRKTPRTRVRKGAQLLYDHPCAVIACTVHDVSTGGACLQTPIHLEVPEVFELSFDSFRSARWCEVRWRDENRLGVSFNRPD